MYEITYTCKNEGFIHKLRCAQILKGLMKAYDEVELKMKRYDYDAVEELIKEEWKPFSIRDYMKLDLQKGKKVLVSVTGAYMNERELAERICIAMTRVN